MADGRDVPDATFACPTTSPGPCSKPVASGRSYTPDCEEPDSRRERRAETRPPWAERASFAGAPARAFGVRPLEEERRSPDGPEDAAPPDCAFCACTCARTVQQSPLWAGRPVIFDRAGDTLSSAVRRQPACRGAGHSACVETSSERRLDAMVGRGGYAGAIPNGRAGNGSAHHGGRLSDAARPQRRRGISR
jgi:hypothetical protein